MGTGKTLISLMMIKEKGGNALVICSKNLLSSWKFEI